MSELFYTTKKCEACCLCSCTLHGRHHFHTERFTTEMQRFVNLKEISQEQCVSWACELSIKRSMKKKYNGEVYKLRKTFAVFHLVHLFIERGTSTWLAAE